MKKDNPGSVSATKQRKMLASKARRARRKVRLAAYVTDKLRLLLVRYGKLEQQLKTQELELAALRPAPVAPVEEVAK